MINRNEVAREKMQRAAEMLQDNNIDMWVFYARLKTDTGAHFPLARLRKRRHSRGHRRL